MTKSIIIGAIASGLSLSVLVGCANSPLGNSVQRSLEADPQLEESPPFEGSAPEDAETASDTPSGRDDEPAVSSSVVSASTDEATAPEPGDASFIGPVMVQPANRTVNTDVAEQAQADEADRDRSALEGIPDDFQAYIQDLRNLELLEIRQPGGASDKAETDLALSPFGQVITRREYARWLFDAYNTIYADEPGERLRPGNPADEAAFQDVGPQNSDFAAIQGLAEAGIIPSTLTGNSTDVKFRPDAPLTREDLILWKVPLDTRSPLPTTTPEAVQETWGFQDAASIEPLALRAIAADFQLGDFANTSRAFGYTTLFRPDKPVSRAEAAAALWRFGTQTDGLSAADVVSIAPQADP